MPSSLKKEVSIVRIYAAAVIAAMSLAGCSSALDSADPAAPDPAASVATVAGGSAAEVLAANKAVHSSDPAWSAGSAATIDVATGPATISQGGVFRLTGALQGGQVVVNAPGAEVKLVLDGVDITNASGAAIVVNEAETVTVILAEGSANTLRSSASGEATLDSSADLTIAGEGSLNVHSARHDGIASSDGLVIESGTIAVDAADDGIRGKDYLVLSGGTVDVTAGGDGLSADNEADADSGYIAITGGTVTVDAANDGADAFTDLVVTGGSLDVTADGDPSASKGLKSGVITVLEAGKVAVSAADDGVHSDGDILLTGASVTVASGDDGFHAEATLRIDAGKVDVTRSVEGLEAKDIAVNGGEVTVVSSDDGANAAGGTAQGGGERVGDYSLRVTGGTLVIDAGGDGFDSNGIASISGGTVVVHGPTQTMNGALDVNGAFEISGGVLLAAGSAGMPVAPDSGSAQGWLSATLSAAVPAGSTLQIADSGGKVVATFVTSKIMQNVVYSSPEVVSGAEYEVYIGGSAHGTAASGLAEAGTLDSARQAAAVTSGQAPARGFRGPR